jgi:hypothetical protein
MAPKKAKAPAKVAAKAVAKAAAGSVGSSDKPLPATIADVNVKHYARITDDLAIIESCPLLKDLHDAVPPTIAQGGRQAPQRANLNWVFEHTQWYMRQGLHFCSMNQQCDAPVALQLRECATCPITLHRFAPPPLAIDGDTISYNPNF